MTVERSSEWRPTAVASRLSAGRSEVRLFPLRDLNPTRVTPLVTLLVIAVNVGVFFGFQPQTQREGLEFTVRHAAIACELTTGEPISIEELQSDDCFASG